MSLTPKEKAVELIEKFKPFVYPYIGSSFLSGDDSPMVIMLNARRCALIAVDEILKIDAAWFDPSCATIESSTLEYWELVKQEIEQIQENVPLFITPDVFSSDDLPNFPDSKSSQSF